MKISRSIFVQLSLVFAVLVFIAAPARAQYIYGITALQLDPDLGQVYGYSATALDYYACYYYDAAVGGTLYEGSTAIDSGFYHGVCAAEVYTDGTLHDDRLYTQVSDHYIIAYYYYYYYGGWYDPYGFFGFGPGNHGGGFNYYGCYCPAYFAQSTQDLGSTQVALYNQGSCNQTPVLNGPTSPVTRGATATFTITNRCNTAQIRDWSFTDGNNNTVNRGASNATSWSGPMVTSGTVKVTVQQGGNTHNLSKQVTVNPRSNFSFTAKPATKVENGAFTCDGTTLQVPDPPTAPANPAEPGEAFGKFSICLRFSYNFAPAGPGPNQGYRYVTAASDSLSGVTPQNSTFAWTITPQLEDTGSDLYRAQCGRDGFISGAQLKANTVAHESGATNSHYSRYVAAQNEPANNVKVGLEAVVGPPSESEADFKTRVENEGSARQTRIINATKVEPCGRSDVTLDEACQDHGNINYTPYRACSPTNLNGQAASSSQVNLSWTDGSFNETGFRVERREASGSYSTLATLAAGVTSYSDTSVTGSRAYVYRVFAFTTASGDSASSNEVTVNVPPPAPTGLSAEARKGQIGLSWSYSGGTGDAFKIERRTSAGAFAEITTTAAGALSYTDTGLLSGTTYTYRVRATGPFGTSAPSNEASATTAGTAPSPPQAPSNLSGSAASMALINLFWTDNSGDEQGFKIERSTWGGAFVEIASVGAGVTSYADASVGPGTSYAYQVRAWSDAGSSAPSAQLSVSTPPAGSPPNAPCCIWGQFNGVGSVTLWWSDLSNDEDGFVVERNDGWGFYGVLYTLPNQTTMTDYGLQQGQTYTYRIVAENAYGQSYSEELYYYSPYWWEQ